MNRTVNMTIGNPTKLILHLAVPLMLTNLGQQLYGIVDAIIVGKGIGVNAFASLGACDWLVWLVLWTITGLTQGFSSLIAQRFGAKDREGVRHAVGMCVQLCLLFGIAVTAIGLFAAGPFLKLLGTPAEIFDNAVLYLSMIWGGTLITTGYNRAAALLRAVGDGRTPLIAMFTAGLSNILLDLLFVMVFHMGIPGAALATLLAQLLAFLYCLRVMIRVDVFRLHRDHLRWNGQTARTLLKLGFPMALSAIIVDIGGIVAQSIINTYGYVFVAGCTAANKLHGTLDTSAVAIGFATSAYIGQNCGAGRIDRIHTGIRKATVISLAIGCSITVLMFIFGRPVVGLFLSADAENAAGALETAYQYVLVMSAMLPGAYLMNLYRYSVQALGNPHPSLISGFFELGARVFVALVFPIFMGQRGLFFMDGAAWWAAGIYLIICFFIELRKIQSA